MKHSFTIQRLCLFLLVLVLAAPAWAQWPPTIYEQQGYELFRSRYTVKFFGTNKPVRTLSQGKVEIEFSDCKTTSGTGNSAIYELAKVHHQGKGYQRLCHPLDHPARHGGWKGL